MVRVSFKNEQMGVPIEEKQVFSAAVDHLIAHLRSEHQKVLDDVTGRQEQRGQLNQEIQTNTAGPVLQSVKETSEVVRLVPLQEHTLMERS